jgi:hypothetical protein
MDYNFIKFIKILTEFHENYYGWKVDDYEWVSSIMDFQMNNHKYEWKINSIKQKNEHKIMNCIYIKSEWRWMSLIHYEGKVNI